MIAGLVLTACLLNPYQVIVTDDVPAGYTAAYAAAIDTIWVESAYRWDAGVMYHEIGHHFYHECSADEHPYWMGKEERFADAWAEHRLGYDVPYYDVPWIDQLWIQWWSELRTFHWKETS